MKKEKKTLEWKLRVKEKKKNKITEFDGGEIELCIKIHRNRVYEIYISVI